MSFEFFRGETGVGSAEAHRGRGVLDVRRLHELGCKACPLNDARVESPKMLPTGVRNPLFYILGEAPGETEDQEGKQFVGDAGKVLRTVASKRLLDHSMFDNTIRDRPPNNRRPLPVEVECCRPLVTSSIEAARPKALLAMGSTALEWCLGESVISKWRGRRIPIRVGSHPCWLYPTWHPSYVMRRGGRGSISQITQVPEGHCLWLDLHRAEEDVFGGLEPPSFCPSPPEVTMVVGSSNSDVVHIRDWLRKCLGKDSVVGFDIETSCIRPYEDGARILSVAVATDESILSVGLLHSGMGGQKDLFALQPILEALRGVAAVVCHHLCFELEWLIDKTKGVENVVRSIPWHDTQVQSYCLDETRGQISLDELCLEHLGKRIKQDHNIDRTKVDKYPLRQVLAYNGHDAWYALQVFGIQTDLLIVAGLEQVYWRQLRKVPTVALTQSVGVLIDKDKNQEILHTLEAKSVKIRQEIYALDVVSEFQSKLLKGFNPSSTKDVFYLLTELLGESVTSTDESVLAQVKHPLAGMLLELRKLEKLRSTYVDFRRKEGGSHIYPDGRLHPQFHTTSVRTGRTSSSNPNMQNFPKRKDAWVRAQVVPPDGQWILAVDYKQIEVCVIGMGSGDEKLVRAIYDDYDTHFEWAVIFAEAHPQLVGGSFRQWKEDKKAVKKFRDIIKNKFVFPVFYGAGPTSISTHLGVPLEKVERIWTQFFKDFPSIKRWQETLVKGYMSKGYVECLTGFRRHAPIAYNEVINTPIQHTASEIVVDGMCRLSERSVREGMPQYQAVMNIHDDLTFYVSDRTLEDDMGIIVKEMLSPEFDFVTVPLSVEVSVGKNWHEMETVGVFRSDRI